MFSFLPNWILIIPILTSLIIIHELGHFFTAKYFGVKVDEFGIGYPPKIIGFKYKGTLYSINAIPIGGFVKLYDHPNKKNPNDFSSQKIYKRIIILSSGAVINLLFPIILYTIMFFFPHTQTYGTVTIVEVAPNSPAQSSGLKTGDKILSINGKNLINHSELVEETNNNLGKTITLNVRKSSSFTSIQSSPETSTIEEIQLKPRKNPPKRIVVEKVEDPLKQISLSNAQKINPNLNLGDKIQEGSIGITIGLSNPKQITRKIPPEKAFTKGFEQFKNVLSTSILGWKNSSSEANFTGPIGIAQATGQIASFGITPLLNFVGFLSISLGILNLLPIPSLDGGRLLFVIIELFRKGKKLSPQTENLIHFVGFLGLISLILILSYVDIVRIISGQKIF
ncbi:MAG: PDZ domain-containing protein [SAR202 cluster bacterium]|nr:PDZ domain-containing protein [SAR202 cluster bacterium]|tara:strand:+ start:26318 stop:27502 length:1185 start_codon:yes stop_codon:yes gene_type:complete